MKIPVLVVTAAAILAGSAALAAAQPMARGRGARPDLARFQRELGLNDEQAAQLRKLWSEERKQAIRRRADLAIARMELEEALDASTVDEKLVESRVRAVSDLQAAAVRARADQRLAVRKVLTPEQQQKLRQLRSERRRDASEAAPDRRSPRPARRMRSPRPPGGPAPDAQEDPAGPGR